MIRFSVVVLVFCSLTVTACKHAVESPDSTLKDPRTYTWTIDTLFFARTPGDPGQILMGSMWGVNDTLVYTVGWDMWGGLATMWKFQGKNWERVKLSAFGNDGGPFNQQITMFDVKGFDANNIYAAGETTSYFTNPAVNTSFAIHFDGLQWRKIDMPQQAVQFTSIVLSSSSQVYFGADHGQLFFFDGLKWSVDTLKCSRYTTIPMYVSPVAPSGDGGLYLKTAQYAEGIMPIMQYFIKYKNKQVTLIDSSAGRTPWGGYNFWQGDNGTVFSCGVGGIFCLSNNQWRNTYSAEVIFSIYGYNNEPVFATGIGGLYFNNGTSWELIYNVNDYRFLSGSRIWCTKNEVFLVYCDAVRSYVLNGK
ncbi:MAG TPA: hypothetical protein VK141_06325 [Nitrosomonas sp.]|nr:hypothetical protein [Nitrosomonas sp.]